NEQRMVCRNPQCNKVIDDPDEIIDQIEGLIEKDFIERNRGTHKYITCAQLIDKGKEMLAAIGEPGAPMVVSEEIKQQRTPGVEVPKETPVLEEFEEKNDVELLKEWKSTFDSRIIELHKMRHLSDEGKESLKSLSEWFGSIIEAIDKDTNL